MHPAGARRAILALVTSLTLVGAATLGSGPAEAAAKLGPTYRVTHVSDGDTIKVVVKGKAERVRLIGIDTPELGRDGAPDQCHARIASKEMKKLVQGKRVHLQRDKTQANRDTYGRLLRYVYTTKRRDVGKVLISNGHGREFTYKKPYKHRSQYRAAQRRAKKAGKGLWTSCASDEPASSPTPAPGTCVIKGNISDSGEKIYHVPGQQSYDDTVITPEKGERWFCTEDEAVAAGWGKSKV